MFDPWVVKIPRERNDYPAQYSCLENYTDWGAAGYSPWGSQESGMTELQTTITQVSLWPPQAQRPSESRHTHHSMVGGTGPWEGEMAASLSRPRRPQHIGLAAPQGDAQPPVGHQCPKSWEIGPQAPGRVCTFHTSISVPEEGDLKWQISEKHHDKLRDFWVQGESSIL